MKHFITILLSTLLIMSCNTTKTTTETTVVTPVFDRNIQPTPGPAPKVKLGKPKTFSLDNGLKVLVVENAKLPRVSVTLTLDNLPLFEGEKSGVSQILGSILGSGTKTLSKDAFNERIDFLGAKVSYRSTGGNMKSLSKFFPEVFGLMADGALQPNFTEEEFDKEKAKLIDNVKSGEKSVENISGRVENILAYGTNHPYGEFIKVSNIEKLTLQDVEALYNTYYVPNNGYLVIIGDVKYDEVKPMVEKYFGQWKKGNLPEINMPETKNVASTELDFVDMPEASQTQINIISTSKLTMDNPDYHALLVANHIFGGDFNSHLNMNLREQHGFTYGARSSIPADKYISMFSAGAKVRNQVADSAVVEVMKELDRMYIEKVTDEELKTVKASYSGNFVMNVEKPETIARYALNIQKNKLPENFYETFLEKINAVTADDVMIVVKKYFNKDNTRIVVTSKGSEVLPALEKLGYKINYYDKEGMPTEKPKMPEMVSQDITAENVLNYYFEAVGGKEKLTSIQTIQQTYEMTMQGMPLENVYKMQAPNKMSVETIVMGQSYGKMVYDGENGYMEQMGTKMPMPAEQVEEMKAKKGIIDELYILDADNQVSVEGIFQVNEKDAYKLKIISGENTSFKYFDKESGLLVREEKEQAGPDGTMMTIPTDFLDYKEVSGLKVAHRVITKAMGQEMEMTVKELIINPVFPEGTFK